MPATTRHARDVGALLRRSELRWTVVVVILTVAGVIALWPTDTRRAGPAATTAATAAQVLGVGPRTSPAPVDSELTAPRERAALNPCPSPQPRTAQPRTAPPELPPGAGPLAGITVPCLGAPGAVDLGAALAGRAAVLNVWASWCRPCREEIPVLAAYANSPGAVAVIGINVQDRPADALAALTALGVHYPSVSDPDAALLAALRSPPVLPLTYVLRADGSVAWVDPPVVFRTPEEVARAVARRGGVPPA